MWKKLLAGLVVIILVAVTMGWLNRAEILTSIALNRAKANHYPVAPNRVIEWERGPAVAQIDAADQPPNIVFILLDDLGINDITTFGGGVADGRVPTPKVPPPIAQPVSV